MERSAIVVLFILGFGYWDVCNGLPIDFSSVGTGKLNAIWLTSSLLLAVGFLIGIVSLIIGCICCRNGRGFQQNEAKPTEEFRNSNGCLASPGTGDGFVNPSSSEITIFPPFGIASNVSSRSSIVHFEPLPNIKPQAPNLRPAAFSYSEQEISSRDWFYDPYNNFPRNQLKYLQEYGKGWFGRVVEGEAQSIVPREKVTKVIVKILHEDATPTDQMYFLHEVKFYRDLKHPNILGLLGRCLETEPFLILLESCPNGDLKSFLTQNMASAHALVEQGVTLRMCSNITSGLEFMHENKFIHTDLAARNCLVSPDLTVKIGDYGNSIEIFRSDYYCAGSVALPVRWCAPETLKCTDITIETREVTPVANVWTLAVVFWEICEFCKLPYEELNDDQVIVRVLGEKNYFLHTPKMFCLYKDELYHLMKLCWNPPLQRPTAAQIGVILGNLLSSNKGVSDGRLIDPRRLSQDFEQRWQKSKPNYIPKRDDAGLEVEEMTTATASPKFGGAKVADSSYVDSPLGMFMSSKDGGHDSPRLTLKPDGGDVDVAEPFAYDADEYFPGLKKSDSVKNLSGSLDRLNTVAEELRGLQPGFDLSEGVTTATTTAAETTNPDIDSWLKGVEVKNEEDETFIRKISEAIRDLDAALAMERTSSSEENSGKSSHQCSPGKETKEGDDDSGGVVVGEFKLGGDASSSFINFIPKSFELSSLQNSEEPQSLNFDNVAATSGTAAAKNSFKLKGGVLYEGESLPFGSQSRNSSDTEEEVWRKRIERGEFSEKVKEKSKSIANLMVLTHIDASDESDVDADRSFDRTAIRGSYGRRHAPNQKSSLSSNNFGSENDLTNAVLEETFKESLKKLSNDHKEYGRFDSLGMILPAAVDRENVWDNILRKSSFEESGKKPTDPSSHESNSNFLGEVASKNSVVSACCTSGAGDCPGSSQANCPPRIPEIAITEDNSPAEEEEEEEGVVVVQKVRPFRFVLKDADEKTEVIIGACEDYTLDYFKGLKTTFGGGEKPATEVVNLDVWDKHLEKSMTQILDSANFDDVTFFAGGGKEDDSSATSPNSSLTNVDCKDKKSEDSLQSSGFTNLNGNTSEEEYENNKLRTPDDERSSDSGFRDKGSLSESVEDACEGKYNLEDIEAELEEAVKEKGTNSNNFAYEETKFYGEESKNEDDLSDIDGEIEFWQNHETSDYYPEMSEFDPVQSRHGWYLHPPDENLFVPSGTGIDEEFVNALRDELRQKLPVQSRSFREFSEDFEGGPTTYEGGDCGPKCGALSPILEEQGEEGGGGEAPPGRIVPGVLKTRKAVSNLLESGKDTNAFRNYLDHMVETEGKERLTEGREEDSLEESRADDDIMVVDTETNQVVMLPGEENPPRRRRRKRDEGEESSPCSSDGDRSLSEPSRSSNGSHVGEASPSSPSDILSECYLTPEKSPLESPDHVAPATAESSTADAYHSAESRRVEPAEARQEEAYEMSTSFMGELSEEEESPAREEEPQQTTGECTMNDWESMSSGGEEELSSSSGEFIWKDGDKESMVRAKRASEVLFKEPEEEEKAERSVEEEPQRESCNDEEEGEESFTDNEDEGSSTGSSASITDFVPSAWNSQATPSRPALRSPDKKSENQKRSVWFKKQKYHCIYEYPREPSDTESANNSPQKHFAYGIDAGDVSSKYFAYGLNSKVNPAVKYFAYGLSDLIDCSNYVNWEEGEAEGEGERQQQPSYGLNSFDYDFSGSGLANEDEFFVSSSARPFQVGSSSQFFPSGRFEGTPGEKGSWQSFATPDSGVEDLTNRSEEGSAVGGTEEDGDLSKVIEHLKLNLGKKGGGGCEGKRVASEAFGENDSSSSNDMSNSSLNSPTGPLSPTGLGELRHARGKLKLDLPLNHNVDLDKSVSKGAGKAVGELVQN